MLFFLGFVAVFGFPRFAALGIFLAISDEVASVAELFSFRLEPLASFVESRMYLAVNAHGRHRGLR
jgi:hypothetical protein